MKLNAIFLDARLKKVRLVSIEKSDIFGSCRKLLNCDRIEHFNFYFKPTKPGNVAELLECYTDEDGGSEITNQEEGTLEGVKMFDLLGDGHAMLIPKGVIILAENDYGLVPELESMIIDSVKKKQITFVNLQA